MSKCIREECTYQTHSNAKNNGGLYCCKGCRKDGFHGLLCEKIAFQPSLIIDNFKIDNISPFQKIIDDQIKNKQYYVRGPNPPRCGVSVKIKDNKIAAVLNHRESHNTVRVGQYVQLLKNTLKKYTVKDCYVNIQIRDVPVKGYFNFCRNIDNNTDFFLLPNHRFQTDDTQILDEINNTETYDEEKALLQSNDIPFETKENSIYTSSSFQYARTNYYMYALNNTFCKGVLYYKPGRKPFPPLGLLNRLREKNLVSTTYTPFIKHINYKYVLYTDGNTLSDRMRLLLCLNSVIMRKVSQYEEFYTYKLEHNRNYIEYENEDELEDIYNNLESNPTVCNNIIKNNKTFIDEILNYENILRYTADIINAIC
jgi:hypothetical protein